MSFVSFHAGERTRRALIWISGVALLLGTTLGTTLTSSAATPIVAGYADHLYGAPSVPGGDDVTAFPNQSKLWFHDGRWFALMLDNVAEAYRIYRFDMNSQNWTSTGTQVDQRNRSHADALSDGNTLWVASSYNASSSGTLKDLRVYKFTYNTGTKAYTVAGGYPKLIPGTSTGTTNATIAKDTTGDLWVTYNQDLRVRYSASEDGGATWSTGADIPGQGNDGVADDVAAIAPVSGSGVNGVGVIWTNQAFLTDDAFYYQAHVDGDPIGTWQARETAFGGPATNTADNHAALKTAPDGRAIAVVKTSRNAGSGNSGDPLIAVLRRTGAPNAVGTWEVKTVTTVAVKGTRPMLVVDGVNSEVNVFLTNPTLASEGDQAIYRRTASLSTLNFGTPSLGTAVIDSATEVAINDATSTKQASTPESGMLVLASNIPTFRYFHACIGGPCPVKPVANFTVDTTSGDAPLAVQFTDTSTNSPTTWAWDFDNNGSTDSTVQNPQFTYLTAGQKTVTLTASNGAGSSVKTRVNLITVTAPPVGYFPIDPVRILDTRVNNGLPGKFVANVTRTWQVNGRGGIPADAIAVTGNLTVANQSKAGYISIGPTAAKLGTTSSLNFPVGDIRANGVTLPVDLNGQLSAVYKASSGTTNLILDVTGYFLQTDSGGATYHAVEPVRLLDTRVANGLTGTFVNGVPRTWQITDREGIPSDATAITGNLTIANQSKAGYVSLGPVAEATPETSTINFPAGDIRANGVTVKLSPTGTLSAVYKAASGTTNLILDVTGYFTDDGTGARFVSLEPVRVLDSRVGTGLSGPFVSSAARTWAVGGQAGIAGGADAVVGNVTVVNQTGAGYVSVTPVATSMPLTSTINFPVGDIRANGITVQLGSGGSLSAVYKASGGKTTHLIFDVFGYYE